MSALDMLGGLGGGPGGPPPPSGFGPPEPSPPDTQSQDPAELVRKALELIRQAAIAEPDDIDQAKLEKVSTEMAAYLADQQKLTDGMMGTSDVHRGVRKTLQRGAPPGAPVGGPGGY